MTDLNRFFAFILRSCPYLKSIALITEEDPGRGFINLDFRENQLLHYARLDFPHCRYYTFHHEFEKRWRNTNDQTMGDDGPARLEHKDKDIPLYSVNLA